MSRRTESEEIVHAIRRGGVDALVIMGEDGERVAVLQGSEHAYRMLVENFSDGAATLDSAGTIVYANDRFAEILGAARERLLGARLLDRISWHGRDDLGRIIRKGISGEVVLRTNEKPQRIIRFTAAPLKVKSSRETNICLIATELTDLVKVTEALRSSNENLKNVSARVLSLQDEERRRIARDLHDITGQTLAVQSMMLGELLERASALDPEMRKLVSECASLNKRITGEIRTLSYLLHPPLIDECGLAPAVKWYAEGFAARSGINISVECDPDFPRLAPEAEIALFRVVQESLTNIHRHSNASRGTVRLRRTDAEVILEIEDSGKGLTPSLAESGSSDISLGVGILGMRQRLRQLSGTLEIISHECRGTIVIAHLPLRDQKKNPEDTSKAQTAKSSAGKRARAAKSSR